MRRTLTALIVCLAFVPLAGCWNVLSTKPLGQAPPADEDIEKFEGVWAWPGATSFHVKHVSGNEFRVAWLEWKDGNYRVTQCKALLTQDDEKWYVNVVAPTEGEELYYIMRMGVVGENYAVLYLPVPKEFAAAVDEGVVTGTVARDSRGRVTKVYLRPEGDELERLIDAARAGVQFDLDHPIALHRISKSP